MVHVLLVVLRNWIGMPPALCFLQMPWSRSAMDCTATNNPISALLDCLHRPSQI